MYELGAKLDRLAVEVQRMNPSTDTVASFQHKRGKAVFDEFARGHETRDTCPDDDDIPFLVRHIRVPGLLRQCPDRPVADRLNACFCNTFARENARSTWDFAAASICFRSLQFAP